MDTYILSFFPWHFNLANDNYLLPHTCFSLDPFPNVNIFVLQSLHQAVSKYVIVFLNIFVQVLWVESGWKPVPLVNIIEGNGVKRAYQRAMLCLHPDKLQQKGASSHQKYTAEKVFDILQVIKHYLV